MDMNGMNQAPKANPVGLILGIVGLVVGIVGGITFGVIGAIIGLACGVVGLVLSIVAKKNGLNAGGAFTCSLLATIFSAIFFLGCAATGCIGCGSYGCYGCVGGSCLLSNDIDNAYSDAYDALSALDALDW